LRHRRFSAVAQATVARDQVRQSGQQRVVDSGGVWRWHTKEASGLPVTVPRRTLHFREKTRNVRGTPVFSIFT